jgi:hypothetical protein
MLISIARRMGHFQRRIVGQRRVCSGHVSHQVVASMIQRREDLTVKDAYAPPIQESIELFLDGPSFLAVV